MSETQFRSVYSSILGVTRRDDNSTKFGHALTFTQSTWPPVAVRVKLFLSSISEDPSVIERNLKNV